MQEEYFLISKTFSYMDHQLLIISFAKDMSFNLNLLLQHHVLYIAVRCKFEIQFPRFSFFFFWNSGILNNQPETQILPKNIMIT